MPGLAPHSATFVPWVKLIVDVNCCFVRRVKVLLEQATRDGDWEIFILTNLPSEERKCAVNSPVIPRLGGSLRLCFKCSPRRCVVRLIL